MENISRGRFITMSGAGVLAFALSPVQVSTSKIKEVNNMYGLIGKITAKSGQRDALIDILLKGAADMPGCLSYIISKDSKDQNALWITEVWESKESHKASLELPSVKEAMHQGQPLIAAFDSQTETVPVGGHGLVSSKN